MTLLFAESFNTDDSASELIWSKWTYWDTTHGSMPSIVTTGGRRGSGCFRFWNVNGYERGNVGKYLGAQYDTLIFGSAYYFDELDPNESLDGIHNMGFKFTTGNSVGHLAINFIRGTNSINVRRGGTNGTLLVSSGDAVLPQSTWFYVEGKIHFDDTVGSVEIRINGKPVIDISGVDTRNGTSLPNTFHIGGIGYNISVGAGNQKFDDIYVCDDSGTFANDFLGDVAVMNLKPNGAGANTNWTPSAGSNYECVNDLYIDTADYVSSTASGIYDTYSFDNLSVISGAVHGVQMTAYTWKTNAGFKKSRFAIRPDTTTYDGNVLHYLQDSGTYVQEIVSLNPETSSQWTIAEVNSAELGVKPEQ